MRHCKLVLVFLLLLCVASALAAQKAPGANGSAGAVASAAADKGACSGRIVFTKAGTFLCADDAAARGQGPAWRHLAPPHNPQNKLTVCGCSGGCTRSGSCQCDSCDGGCGFYDCLFCCISGCAENC